MPGLLSVLAEFRARSPVIQGFSFFAVEGSHTPTCLVTVRGILGSVRGQAGHNEQCENSEFLHRQYNTMKSEDSEDSMIRGLA